MFWRCNLCQVWRTVEYQWPWAHKLSVRDPNFLGIERIVKLLSFANVRGFRVCKKPWYSLSGHPCYFFACKDLVMCHSKMSTVTTARIQTQLSDLEKWGCNITVKCEDAFSYYTFGRRTTGSARGARYAGTCWKRWKLYHKYIDYHNSYRCHKYIIYLSSCFLSGISSKHQSSFSCCSSVA